MWAAKKCDRKSYNIDSTFYPPLCSHLLHYTDLITSYILRTPAGSTSATALF